MQSSDEADNSSVPKARAKAGKGFRGARSWGLRGPKKGSAEAEDAPEAEAVAADQSSKSMTDGSTRFVCTLPPFSSLLLPVDGAEDLQTTGTACT